MMNERSAEDLDQARAEGAAREREAILAILERYSRRLSYGHGETGVHVLQQVVEEIRQRAGAGTGTSGR
jgi:hypothetical protein